MLRLRLAPAAKDVVDREQPHLRIAVCEPSGDGGIARTEVIARDDLLAVRRVEILQIRFRDGSRPLAVDDRVYPRNGGLGEDAHGRCHDLESAAAHLRECEQRFVFPREQHVAQTALYEGVGGAASTGIQHGDATVYVGHELLSFLLCSLDFWGWSCLQGAEVAAQRLLERITPRREVIPASAARGLRVRRDDLDIGFQEIRPIADPFWIAGSNEKHDRRGVRSAVVRQARLPIRVDLFSVEVKSVDVPSQSQRNDVRLEAVDHGPCLRTRAAVRLTHYRSLARPLAPMRRKLVVELSVM